MTTLIREIDRQSVTTSDLGRALREARPGDLLSIAPIRSTCCMGRCCFEGKKIKGIDFAPHPQGIAILTGSGWILNESTPLPDKPTPLQELQFTGSRMDGYEINDWHIASHITVRWKGPRFFEHPRGILIALEQTLPDGHYFAFDLLVLNDSIV